MAIGNILGMIAGPAIGAVAGGLMQDNQRQKQLAQQQKLMDMQKKGAMELSKYNQDLQMDMWNRTNVGAQIEHYKKAGMNPALMYGMGGGGGTTTGSGGGGMPSVATAENPSAGVAQQMGMAMMKSQLDLMQAQAKKTNVEADKIAGVDTENIKADTENKILTKVITDLTGKEMKDVYERVKAPNRPIEAKTWQNELEAKQAIATTIYEMWENGKLTEKSLGEVEQVLLNNAKTREEIKNIMKTWDMMDEQVKGIKLENIMKDLESKLQTETGIDRNSPAWLKILGRLFIGLTQ